MSYLTKIDRGTPFQTTDASYELWLLNGVGQRIFGSPVPFMTLDASRAINQVGSATFVFPYTKIDRNFINPDYRWEIWRAPYGSQPTLLGDTFWLMKTATYSFDERGNQLWTLGCSDANVILKSRIVAYNANSSQALKNTYGDNLIKAVMRENFGSSASAARNISSYLSIQADHSLGPAIYKALEYRNVMDIFGEVVETSIQLGTAVFFDLVYNLQTLEFRTYIGQRGVDRRAIAGRAQPLIIGPGYKNVGPHQVITDYSNEVTFVYAIGPNTYGVRPVQTAENTSRSTSSPFSRIETVIQSNQIDSTILTNEARAELQNNRARISIEAQMRNVPTCMFGTHWTFGDRVTFEPIPGWQIDVRNDAFSVSYDRKQENLNAFFRSES